MLAHKKEENTLQQIVLAINYMDSELQYRLTPLPQLLFQSSKQTDGIAATVFAELSAELENQISPDVLCCMNSVLLRNKNIPKLSEEAFRTLGQSLGRFDIQGQLQDLEAVRAQCLRHLHLLETDRDTRLRSYKTLGLCAGAALAILLL